MSGPSPATAWLEGVGLHTGAACRARITLAPPGHGLAIRRADRGGAPARLSPAMVVETERRTVLAVGGDRVETVEHLLAAIAGMGVWDALVEVEGPEVPALDGSALPFVRALLSLGPPGPAPEPIRLGRALSLERGASSAVARPSPCLSVSCTVRFDHPAIGEQRAAFRGSRHGFRARVAPARTFGFLDEVMALRAKGLARGGSLESALVFDREGPMGPLRLPREPARHKLLDALGDLALLGRPLAARVRLDQPGHGLTCALAAAVAAAVKGWGSGGVQMLQKRRRLSAENSSSP